MRFVEFCVKIGGKPISEKFCSVEPDRISETLKKIAQLMDSVSDSGEVSVYNPRSGYVVLKIDRGVAKSIYAEIPIADTSAFPSPFESFRDELDYLSEYVRGSDLMWLGFDVLKRGEMREGIDFTNGGLTYTYWVESKGTFRPSDIEELAQAFEEDELDMLRDSVVLAIEQALEYASSSK